MILVEYLGDSPQRVTRRITDLLDKKEALVCLELHEFLMLLAAFPSLFQDSAHSEVCRC